MVSFIWPWRSLASSLVIFRGLVNIQPPSHDEIYIKCLSFYFKPNLYFFQQLKPTLRIASQACFSQTVSCQKSSNWYKENMKQDPFFWDTTRNNTLRWDGARSPACYLSVVHLLLPENVGDVEARAPICCLSQLLCYYSCLYLGKTEVEEKKPFSCGPLLYTAVIQLYTPTYSRVEPPRPIWFQQHASFLYLPSDSPVPH